MMGRIAAGVPIAAIQDHTANVPVPPDMLRSGEHFALEVQRRLRSSSAGILDGDTVIIRKVRHRPQWRHRRGAGGRRGGHPQAACGARANSIALWKPPTRPTKTRIFGPDQVRVQGTLAGLIRRY